MKSAPDPGLQQEAERAWGAWTRTWPTPGGTNAPKTEEQAFLAGAEWAAAPRDQRIKELEAQISRVNTVVHDWTKIPDAEFLAALNRAFHD